MNEKTDKILNQTLKLREVEGAEIISLMDNSVDFHSKVEREEVQNFREWTKKYFRLPIAEHGFSMLIRVFVGEETHRVLFDTGISSNGVMTNAKIMGLNLSEIECIVLSHGHYDHFGGLPATVKAVNKENLHIIVHDDMFKTRGVANPEGTVRKYPDFPAEKDVKPVSYIKTKQPHLIANDLMLITGEIPRTTSFEKGYPRHRVLTNGKWHPDPWIWDDRALIINVKQKGLIILSGCAHAGIINTALYAKKLTTTGTICAILGGFHLAGKEYEQAIDKTVEKLKELKPALVGPSHCTGWKGAFAIAKALPQAFVWNGVGNLYRF